MASLAVRQGLPGEAQQVLKRGFASGTLNASNKERTQDVAEKANQQAAQDKKTLAQQEKAAQASKDGQIEVGLGEAYLSYDQNADAVAALQRGIQKGGVKDVDAAYLSLGRAYMALNNPAEAGKAFDQVKGKQLAQIAELWSILAAQG
jgi:tetratricopeptide (TPR) repeat protein